MEAKHSKALGYFIPAIIFIAHVAIFVHFVLLIYFAVLDIDLLIYYNAFSIGIYYLLKRWLKKGGSANLIFLIILFKILLGSIFAALLLGEESSSLYFIVVLPIIFLVHPHWGIRRVLTFFSFLLIIFFISYYFITKQEPLLADSIEHNKTTHLIFIILICLSGYSILLFIKSTTIENRNSLISANNNLSLSNKEVRKQYKKQEILLKEMHHRVKNNLQLISSMLSLQKHRLIDQKSIDILENSQSRIHAISLIHQKLFQQEDVAVVNLNFYLQDLVSHLKWLNTKINCEIKAIDLSINLDIAVPLGLITAELLNNSFKHAFTEGKSGEILILLEKTHENTFQLSIQDSGKGFKKGFDPKKSNGLGMEIILTLSEQIGADVEFIPLTEGALSVIEFKIDDFNIIG